MTSHLPPSFEHTETFGAQSIDSHNSRSRRRKRILSGVLLSAVAVASLAILPRIGDSDQNTSDTMEIAADYPSPDDGYVPPCESVTTQAEKLIDLAATSFVELYHSDLATDKRLANFSDTPGSYGNIFFSIPASNGEYHISMIAATDSNGELDGKTAYAADISSVVTDSNELLYVSLGSPTVVNDRGGPNFPIGNISLSLVRESGISTYWSWHEDPSEEQCLAVTERASELIEGMISDIESRAPVRMPDSLIPA